MKIFTTFFLIVWILFTGALIAPTAIANNMWTQDQYREFENVTMITNNTTTEIDATYENIESILDKPEETRIITLYFKTPTVDNFSGLFQNTKTYIYKHTIKQYIFDHCSTKERQILFNKIENFMSPQISGNRAINFEAIDKSGDISFQIMSINQTKYSDLGFLENTTIYKNKFTPALIGIGFGYGIAYLLILFLTTTLSFGLVAFIEDFFYW